MQSSTEVRWFVSSANTIQALAEWFGLFGQSLDVSKFDRADYYLYLRGITNLGIKIREASRDHSGNWSGKLEAKVLTKELATLKLENGAAGQANQWVKFSFSLQPGEPTLSGILDCFIGGKTSDGAALHWVKMEKSRILVYYDQQSKNFQKEPPAEREGCGIELTAIRMDGEVHHSFAFESFSASGKHEENFFEALNYFFSEVAVPGLSRNLSFGYPEFLTAKSTVVVLKK